MLNTPTVLPGGGLAVSGSINTTPNTLVSIAFYTSPTGDGEGQTLQDVLDVTTDASGNATFAVVLSGAGANDFVTATATSIVFASDSALVNTSEFSAPVAAAAPALQPGVNIARSERDDDLASTLLA